MYIYIKKPQSLNLRGFTAGTEGLEPATPGVTGLYSNQLNYCTIVSAMYGLLF